MADSSGLVERITENILAANESRGRAPGLEDEFYV